MGDDPILFVYALIRSLRDFKTSLKLRHPAVMRRATNAELTAEAEKGRQIMGIIVYEMDQCNLNFSPRMPRFTWLIHAPDRGASAGHLTNSQTPPARHPRIDNQRLTYHKSSACGEIKRSPVSRSGDRLAANFEAH